MLIISAQDVYLYYSSQVYTLDEQFSFEFHKLDQTMIALGLVMKYWDFMLMNRTNQLNE